MVVFKCRKNHGWFKISGNSALNFVQTYLWKLVWFEIKVKQKFPVKFFDLFEGIDRLALSSSVIDLNFPVKFWTSDPGEFWIGTGVASSSRPSIYTTYRAPTKNGSENGSILKKLIMTQQFSISFANQLTIFPLFSPIRISH